MRDLRRIVASIVIGSFSIAALLGILALLGPGEFGETQGRVVLTTVVVGLESLAVLCYLALAGHRMAGVGAAGGVVSLVCAATALWLVWVPWEWQADEPWRLFASTLVLALTLAQASLLIAVADRHHLRGPLVGTLAVAAVVAAMVIGPILEESFPESEGYWRLLGILAILDVLGTIVLMAVGTLGRRAAPPSSAMPRGAAGPCSLDPDVQRRIGLLARQHGVSADDLVTDALDRLPAAGAPDGQS
jgi:hypothetical protein